MAIKLKCKCGERLSAPESAIGKQGKCAKCGMKFVIPDPNASKSKASKLATTKATATKVPKPKSPAAKSASPKPAPTKTGKATDDLGGFDLPDLGGDLPDLSSDMGDLLDDALNEEIQPTTSELEANNPFASPQTSSAPAKSKGKGSRAQMGTVATGIKAVFWGTIMVVVAFLLLMFASIFGAMLGEGITSTMAMAAIGLAVVGPIVCTIGRVLCLRVPGKVGGKGLVIAAVACDLGNSAINIVSALGTEPPPFVALLSPILGLATLILFVLFLKSLAKFVGQESLADDAMTVIATVGIAIGCVILMPLSVLIFPLLAIPVFFVLLGCMLYGLLKYLNLLQHVAEYIRP